MTSTSLQQILHGFNDTAVEYPDNRFIHQIFAEIVARQPDDIAVISANVQLTYAGLSHEARQLAQKLSAAGVGSGDYVAVVIPRSIGMVIAQLAILEVGAAYIPVDPALPDERQFFMIKDSGARCILRCESAVAGQRFNVSRSDVGTDAFLPPVRVGSIGGTTASHPAYLMYTSGSTGVPKGVIISHRAVIRLVINNKYADISRADRIAHCSNPAFDAATFEVWSALLNGARLVVIDQQILLDPALLSAEFAKQGVSICILTTALFNRYAAVLPELFSRLRYMLFGGEAADPAAVRRILRSVPPQHLLNVYGPTEATTYATFCEITALTEDCQNIPIGRPISNTRVYILDPMQRPMPIGETGELYIGGPGVANGYLNRPHLTAETFVPDPFSGEAGGRLYKTGDLGRWRADGQIEFLGRADSQIKVRGFRIEAGEVEAALNRHPEVVQSVVLLREDDPGDKRLVGYIAADPSADAQQLIGTLCAELRQRLPEYMIPTAWMVLPRLPLTPNGKVDRRALPIPESGSNGAGNHIEPRTLSEKRLAAIWSRILRVSSPGAADDFVASGGHSIKAMELATSIYREFRVSIPAFEIFRNPTIEHLARKIEWLMSEESTSDGAEGLPRKENAELAPLSFQQKTFLSVAESTWNYACGAELSLRGRLDVGALRCAVHAVLLRHGALRTRICRKEGEPVQIIETGELMGLDEIDFTSAGGGDAMSAARRFLDELFGRRVDLSVDPMAAVKLLKISDREHVLAVSIHHIVADGASVALLFSEIWQLFSDFVQQRQPSLPRQAVSYADYASWQHATAQHVSMEHRRLHWKSHLAGATRVQMPVDDLPEDLQPYSFRELRISFGTSLSSQLRQLAQVVGTTVAMLILSLYCGLVARWCSQNDFVVNFLVDGRTDPRYSDVVGLFAAGLCLRIRLSGKETFLDLLRLTTSEFFTAYENFDFGDHIREFPDMYRGTRIQWLPWSEEQLAGLPDTSTWDRQGELKVQKFRERSLLVEDGLPPDFKMEEDVVWHFSDGADGIGGRGFYRADRFSRHGIEMFIAELRRICEMAVENPKALVTSFVPSNSCRVVSIPSGHPHPDIAARSR